MKIIILLLALLLVGCSNYTQDSSHEKEIESTQNSTEIIRNTPSSDITTEESNYKKINIENLFDMYILDPLPENMEYTITPFTVNMPSGDILISIKKEDNSVNLCEYLYGNEEAGLLFGHTAEGFNKEDAILTVENDGETYYLWRALTTPYGSNDSFIENNIQNQAPKIYQKLFIEKNTEYLEKYSVENLIKFKESSQQE